MARIAYVGLPAHGHTNPTLPVMKELIRRGHDVVYYNAASFREKVAPTGVDFRPLPDPLPTERELSEALHEVTNASIILAKLSRPLSHFLIDEFERQRPDVVIYDSVAMWGYVGARTHGIPQVCFITTFVLDGSVRAIGVGTMLRFFLSALPKLPELLRWRRSMAREFGADNAGGITEYAPLNIVFTSRAFHPENSLIDQRFRFVGPSLDSALRDGELLLNDLGEGRHVYISLGTINHLDQAFYRAVFDAFADYPARFILSAGKHTDIGQLGRIPENFIVRNYVPQLEILQAVDAFVTHGGMNSVHEGLYYGVPEIVVPHHFEQLLNGRRVAQTGAGLLLGDRRPYGRVTADELRRTLDEILRTARYRDRARHIGETLKEAGGFRRAATEVERFIEEHPAP